MLTSRPSSTSLKPVSFPLVLDLDGTLVCLDTTQAIILKLFIQKPWILLQLPFWFLNGRAYTKARLAKNYTLAPHGLPYNMQLLNFARKEAKRGRPLILATGADQKVAQEIADYLGIFQEVIGSNGYTNLTGLHKREALLKRYGAYGFDYAGDSHIDIHVWQVARKAIVVHPKRGVLKRVLALKGTKHTYYFPRKKQYFWAFLRP